MAGSRGYYVVVDKTGKCRALWQTGLVLAGSESCGRQEAGVVV